MSALAAPMFFREDDEHQRNSIWNLLPLWQKLGIGQETSLALTDDSMISKLYNQDTEKRDCQTLPRQDGKRVQNSCFIKEVCQIF